MGAIEDHHIYGLTLRESANDGSDFANPDADYRVTFLGEDGGLHLKDSAGAVTDVGGTGGGDVATDAIWDAAGDLAVGSGANTAAKLPIGAAGTVPTVISGALIYALRSPVNNIVATDESLSGNNSWVDLTTPGPAVTVTVPASGVVRVTVTCHAYNGTNGSYAGMGFALSGANTVAATGTKCNQSGTSASTFDDRKSATFLLTGLSAGSTTFTAKYNQLGGPGAGHWTDRKIIVEAIP